MGKDVLGYLEQSALRFPDKVAAADLREEITYSQMKERAQQIGSALAAVIPQTGPVPVFLEKSVRALEVFLGAVYAGGFYSLVDVKHPVPRRESILETLDAKVIVTDREHAVSFIMTDTEHADALSEEKENASGETESLSGETEYPAQIFLPGGQAVTILYYEDLVKCQADTALLEERRSALIDTDPLYVNFTSGSTGTPKGVAVSHRSVIDFIDCFTELFGIDETDVIGNQAPFDFDVSVKDLYSALKTGATIQIIPQKYFSIPAQLMDFLADRQVTTLIWAVSALCIVSRLHGFDYRIPEKVKRVIFSGEVMPVKQLNIWREALPEAEYINVYGPTEITCNCTWYRVAREFSPDETLPIGQPFSNERVFLLDAEDHLISETGAEGEICVAGSALALGYYRNPEATMAAFVQNPLNDRYPERIYRTGDLACYDENGDLVFTGRKDHQIKHMGHRIELGEIELAMNALPQVSQCCCIFAGNKITAFYAGSITRQEISERLREKLPDYMVPSAFRQLEQLPLSKNGKIDRQALTAQAGSRRRQ